MASNLTSVAFIYQKKYEDGRVGDLAMRDHPTMMRIEKKGGFTGASWNYAIRYGNPQGIGNVFSTSQTNVGSSKGVQMTATRKLKYGTIKIDGESMRAAGSPKSAAFLELVTMETDGIIEEHGDALGFEMFRDSYGARGRRGSLSGNIVTLTENDDARNFKVGMTVVADDTAEGTSLRTGSTTVASVDEDAGTVTLTSAAAITSFQDNDYLFRQSEENSGLQGFALHLPLTAPASGDSFRGVDRSVHSRLLAGVRINDTGTPIEENAGLVCVKIAQGHKIRGGSGMMPLNPTKFWEVCRRLNAKVEYTDAGGTANYAFESFKIHTPAGVITVLSDPDCPTNRGYVLDMSTWYWKTLGNESAGAKSNVCHIIRDDGNTVLRSATADAIEARTRSMGDLCCTKPGANGVFAI